MDSLFVLIHTVSIFFLNNNVSTTVSSCSALINTSEYNNHRIKIEIDFFNIKWKSL